MTRQAVERRDTTHEAALKMVSVSIKALTVSDRQVGSSTRRGKVRARGEM